MQYSVRDIITITPEFVSKILKGKFHNVINLFKGYRSLKLVRGPTFFKIVARNLPLVTQIYGIEKL